MDVAAADVAAAALMPAHTEPVRIYAEEDRRLPRRLAVIIQAQINSETDALVDGMDATFPEVKRRQGYIAGLKWCLQECQSADKEISG
jgi:hypothetical protein